MKIVRTVLIAAAIIAVLATGAFSITRIIPYYVNHNVTDMDDYKEIKQEPDKWITKDEALIIARAFAEETYGDLVEGFTVKSDWFYPKRSWTFNLASEFRAKDFSVYGPECTVEVYINGEVGLCIYDGERVENIQSLIEDLSEGYLGELVGSKIAEMYGDEAKTYEIVSIIYKYDSPEPKLRITAAPVKDPTNFPELSPEAFKFMSLRIMGGYMEESFDYDLNTKTLKAASDDENSFTREDAVEQAYRQLAFGQGDIYNDLAVKDARIEDDTLGERKIWAVYLAREYRAKDFTLFGPCFLVTFRLNGELNSWGTADVQENVEVIEKRVSEVCFDDVKKYVSDHISDSTTEYEITEVCYKNSEAPVLRVEVRFDSGAVEYYDYPLER